ncbi:hypothetical protein BCJMU51_1748 [Bacillus cereus]|nr:hypothetical protein BCM0045_1763 [Bacillus cereus]BCB99683.1 hypothetical protein BCM0057_1766 [Bacillus cereus]BCC23183.1 hypothetical protein BCM0079_1776 [Bacillus cereus]BCC34788.1 hypothetical protein BCM0105_1778 [Bacillus cereus]BCC40555.1 hypothetical protein BCJMU01_1722 [Bacillus cereus]
MKEIKPLKKRLKVVLLFINLQKSIFFPEKRLKRLCTLNEIKESRSNIILNETLFALPVLDIWGVDGHDNRKNES